MPDRAHPNNPYEQSGCALRAPYCEGKRSKEIKKLAMKSSILTLSWLKYRLFLNRLKQRKISFIVCMVIFLVLAYSGSFSLGRIFHTISLLVASNRPEVMRELTHLLCLAIFLGWIILSIFTGSTGTGSRDLQRLMLFPFSFKRWYVVSIGYGLLDYWIVLTVPIFVWLLVLLNLIKPGTIFLSLFSILAFAVITILLIRILSFWLQMYTRFARYSKLLAAILFFACIIGFNVVVYELGGDVHSSVVLKFPVSQYLVFVPPGLLAECLFHLGKGNQGSFLIFSSALLIYLAVAWWVGYRLGEKVLFERSLKSANRPAWQHRNLFEKSFDFLKPLIPMDCMPIVIKELTYTVRNNRIKLVGGLIILFEGIQHLVFPFPPDDPFIPMLFVIWGYCFMFYVPVFGNIFALEARGVVNNYIMPLDKRRILFGKHIILFLLQWIILTPWLTWMFYRYKYILSPFQMLSALVLCFYLTVCYSLIGALISICFPKPLRFDEVIPFGYEPDARYTLAVFGSIPLPLLPIVSVVYFAWGMPSSLFYKAISISVVVLAILIVPIYWRVLRKIANILERRKEKFLAEFYLRS